MTGSPVLVVIAALAVVNPPRLAPVLTSLRPLGVDSTSIRRQGSEAVVGVGVVISVAVLALLAVSATWVLDIVDVSAPTLRVGTGLVVVLAGIRHALGRPPTAEPALGGWGASLVPVAVPFTCRPDLALVVMSASTIEGLPTALAALAATGLAVVTVAAARVPTGTAQERLIDLFAWAATIGAVAAGVALAVDGVYGV